MVDQNHNIFLFPSRYLLLDIVLVLFFLSFLLGVALGVFNINSFDFEEEPMFLQGFYIVYMGILCWATILRLRKRNISLKRLVGTVSLKNISWLTVLIIIYLEAFVELTRHWI